MGLSQAKLLEYEASHSGSNRRFGEGYYRVQGLGFRFGEGYYSIIDPKHPILISKPPNPER